VSQKILSEIFWRTEVFQILNSRSQQQSESKAYCDVKIPVVYIICNWSSRQHISCVDQKIILVLAFQFFYSIVVINFGMRSTNSAISAVLFSARWQWSGSVPKDLVRDFLKDGGFPNPGFSKSSTQDLNSSRYVIYVDRGADCNIDRCKGIFYSHYFKHNSVYCLYDVLYFNHVLISCGQYDLCNPFVYVSLNSDFVDNSRVRPYDDLHLLLRGIVPYRSVIYEFCTFEFCIHLFAHWSNSGCILSNFENTDCIKNRLLQSLITWEIWYRLQINHRTTTYIIYRFVLAIASDYVFERTRIDAWLASQRTYIISLHYCVAVGVDCFPSEPSSAFIPIIN